MSDGGLTSESLSPAPETAAPQPASAPSSLSVWGPPLLIGLGYLAFWQIVPRIQTESLGAVLVSTVLSLALVVWFNAQVARGFRKPLHFVISLIIAGAAILPLRVLVAFGHVKYPWSLLLMVRGLPDLLFVWLASSLGGLLSFILRSANMIPPVAAVLALVDIWTVLLGGPVGRIVNSDNPTAVKLTQAMTVRLPAPKHTGPSPFPLGAVVGFADFLFIAFFVAAITRFVPGERVYRRMVLALIAVLGIYMLVVLFKGWSLPALLPLAVVMLALHWRYFQYSRSELFAMLYAGIFIAVIGAGFWYMSQSGAYHDRAATPQETGIPAG